MQCSHILDNGRRCRHAAQAGSDACYQHRLAEPPPLPAFYANSLTPAHRKILAEASALYGIDAEVALLRLAVRERLAAQDLQGAARSIESVARVLRLRHAAADPADELNHFIDSILNERAQDALLDASDDLDSLRGERPASQDQAAD